MWFPKRIRHVASVNIEPALGALKKLDESVWLEDQALKNQLAGDRPTQSLFFYSMSREEYVSILSKRPIEQSDVKRMRAYDLLYDDFAYLFNLVEKHYGAGGVFLRAQIARMPPGGVIKEHKDSLIILENTHRLHIPLITTNKLKFVVDGERMKLEAGQLYELNNQLPHWVDNPKNSIDRIHLILDYLPPEYNNQASTEENFKFYIRHHRAARTAKPSDIEVTLPEAVAVVATPDEGKGPRISIQHIDFESKKTTEMLAWESLSSAGILVNADEAPDAIAVAEQYVVVAAGSHLHIFDRHLKHLSLHRSDSLIDTRDMVYNGGYIYLVSRGTDSLLRFDLESREFESGWRFYVDDASKMAAEKVEFSGGAVIPPSNQFLLSGVTLKENGFVLSAENLGNMILFENGDIQTGEIIPRMTSDIVGFGKGVVYLNPVTQSVAYLANYDYRQVDSASLESSGTFSTSFSRGIGKHKKGTVVAGLQPAGLALLDMKNQSVITQVSISEDQDSEVLDFSLL